MTGLIRLLCGTCGHALNVLGPLIQKMARSGLVGKISKTSSTRLQFAPSAPTVKSKFTAKLWTQLSQEASALSSSTIKLCRDPNGSKTPLSICLWINLTGAS